MKFDHVALSVKKNEVLEDIWSGRLVKFKSGRLGIVLSSQVIANNTFLTIYSPDMGIINIRAEDVNEIK